VRQVPDARGHPVALPDRVGRVVSLVPSLTEWLVHAGVGERLVGVTDWCAEPAEVVARLPKVRGTKNPDLRAIRALEPDLVVANAEENRKLDVDRLEAGGLPVFVTMPTTVAGAVAELRDLAAAVGDLPHAAAIDVDLVAAVADAYRGRPPAGAVRPRYACAVWRDPWMWLGRRTYAADLLALAGGEPVLDDPATRYPKDRAGRHRRARSRPGPAAERAVRVRPGRRRGGGRLVGRARRAGRRSRPHLVRPPHPGRAGRVPCPAGRPSAS
jgi:ABC-type Fe3+-hydroxamate transport system substrate-binding protein